jgi:hypothetical protein
MQRYDTRANKCPHDSRDALEQLDRPQTLGTDATGAVHHYSAYDDRVVVVAESGQIERAEDLTDRQLSAWIAYVDDKRGWGTLNYADSFGEILLEALA